jgi:hypothetical protein
MRTTSHFSPPRSAISPNKMRRVAQAIDFFEFALMENLLVKNPFRTPEWSDKRNLRG